MPIGSDAMYVHAHIERGMAAGMTIDEDYIVMTPDAPLMAIAENFAGWDKTKDRCLVEGKVPDFRFQIPSRVPIWVKFQIPGSKFQVRADLGRNLKL